MTSDAPEGRIYPHSLRFRLLLAVAVVCLAALVAAGR